MAMAESSRVSSRPVTICQSDTVLLTPRNPIGQNLQWCHAITTSTALKGQENCLGHEATMSIDNKLLVSSFNEVDWRTGMIRTSDPCCIAVSFAETAGGGADITEWLHRASNHKSQKRCRADTKSQFARPTKHNHRLSR